MTNSLYALDVSKLLDRFISDEIALNKKDISSAATSREWFLRLLKSKIDSKIGEPQLLAEEPFVFFGSYFKGTQGVDVDEYDVLVVLDSNTGVFTQHGVEIGNGSGAANPNHKYDVRFKKEDLSGVSPAKLLNWLKGIAEEVVRDYGGTAPERNGQAITVSIESKNLKIDLVPAGKFIHQLRSGVNFYDIPKGDKENGWILTNPKDDIKLIDNLSKSKENFRNVIRLLKFIKGSYNFLIPSFAIECAVIEHAQNNVWRDNFYADFMLSMAHVYKCLKAAKISDTFDQNNNLLAGVESAAWYAERIENIYESVRKQAEETDEDRAYSNISKALKNQ